MKPEVRRRVLVITVAVVVVLAMGYGFLPKPVSVDVVAAKRGPLRVTVEEEGRTRVKDRFVVSAPVAGYLRRIELDAGDIVRKGQRVASLEPLLSSALDPRSRAEAEAMVSAARAALSAAREKARAAAADAGYSRERSGRMQKLFGEGMIAQDELEQAAAEAEKSEALRFSADAAVSAAQADLERALSALQYGAAPRGRNSSQTVIVRSPVSGSVLKLHRESEGVVTAGDPLIDIGNPRSLEVRVEVLSADAVKLREGTPVLFDRWGGEQALSGKVRVIEPAGFTKISSLGVEEQRVPVIIDVTSPAGILEGLGDGYRLDASFILWEGKDVLQVPASALFRKGDGWALFTVESRRARVRTVEVGHRNGLVAEIVSGFREGELAIAHPDDTVREGVRVRIRSASGE